MILTAAIRQSGVIYTLPRPARHHDIIKHMVVDKGIPAPITGEQGFIDDHEGFIGRKSAFVIALKCNQVRLESMPKLFSEDMW